MLIIFSKVVAEMLIVKGGRSILRGYPSTFMIYPKVPIFMQKGLILFAGDGIT